MRTLIGIIFLFVFLSFPFMTDIHQYISIPNNIITFQSDQSLSIQDVTDDSQSALVGDITSQEIQKHPQDDQQDVLVYKKGDIPVKKVDVSVLKDKKIIPGGQSIGVQLHTLGVLVVGHHLVFEKVQSTSPGEDADIQVGDVILEMDGIKIKQLEDV